jgi:hypothetical protein
MDAPVRKSDDTKPVTPEPPRDELSRNAAARDVLQRAVDKSPDGTTEVPAPPWKRKTKPVTTPKPQWPVFEGDAAAVALRSRLARTRDALLPTPLDALVPECGVPAFGTLRLIGLLLTAAAVAGTAGYLAGDVKPSQLPASTGAAYPPVTPAAALQPDRNSGSPAARTAAIDSGVYRMTDNRATDATPAAGAARQRSMPPATASVSQPPPLADASEIAVRLKLGTDLMAAGDIAAARTMFTRAAEAGNAAGAFALAETYDPAVLRTRHLQGGITPDPALARRWYEAARDMGSGAAPERIARLTPNPR